MESIEMDIIKIIDTLVYISRIKDSEDEKGIQNVVDVSSALKFLHRDYDDILRNLDRTQLETVESSLNSKIQEITSRIETFKKLKSVSSQFFYFSLNHKAIDQKICRDNINTADKTIKDLTISLEYYGDYLKDIEEKKNSIKSV